MTLCSHCHGQGQQRVLACTFGKGCGCRHRDIVRLQSTRHGLSDTPEYILWAGMKARCRDKAHIAYQNYGGRGITVCQDWQESFQRFIEDMGFRPTPQHTIERIDNNLGYAPGNCIWATRLEQARNTRKNVWLTWNGETLTIAEWSKRTGIGESTIRRRKALMWSDSKALSTPIRKIRGVHY